MKFKFVCLNLWQGGNLFDEIVDFLKKEDPDILALQEVYSSSRTDLERKYRSFEALKESLGFEHAAFAPAFLDNRAEGKIEQGNAVFSKFPVTQLDVTFYDRPYQTDYVELRENFPFTPRNLEHVRLETPAGELNVFNTQGIWGMDGGDSERRLAMSHTIVEAVRGQKNTILAGDTNVKPDTETIRAIERHLTNVFKDELTTSFNMRRKDNPGYATAVVDMLFVGPELQVVNHECPDVDISDHLPLVATLAVGT